MYLLDLTDGETTISLKEYAGVCLEYNRWSPAVSGWNGNEYLPVRESIPVIIRGTTGTEVMEKLRNIIRLIDRARRFNMGAAIQPLWLRYQQTASSAVWVALIIGGTVNAPSNFTNQENWKTLYPVYLELDRRGQWLTPDQTNLIENGGFEVWSGDPEAPNRWTISQGDAGVEVTKSTSIVYAGNASVMLDARGTENAELWQTIELPVGTSVKVTGWVRVDAGAFFLNVKDSPSWVSGETNEEWVNFETFTTARDHDAEFGMWGAFTGVAISFLAALPGASVAYVDAMTVVVLNESGEPGDIATVDDVDNGDLATLSFANGSEPYPSPTKFVVSNFRAGNYHPQSFFIVSEPGNIRLLNATDLTVSAPFSKVADTAAFARAADVLRFTPADTNEATTSFALPTELGYLPGGRTAVFANIRNNSTTTAFTVRAIANMPSGKVFTRPVRIAGDADAYPRWVYLGDLPVQRGGDFLLSLRASAASGTLDINSFVFVNLADGTTNVVSIDRALGVGDSVAITLVINHHSLTELSPQVEAIYNFNLVRWSGRGDITIYTQATTIEAVLLATGGASTINRWRQEASAAVLQNDWIASRLPGRLTPE